MFPKGRLSRILQVKEAIFVLLLLVHRRHKGGVRWDSIGAKEEQGLLGRELNPLSDNVVKLPDGKIGRYKIFFLVDFGNIAPISLLANHGDPVGVFGPNPLGFRLSLLWIRTRRDVRQFMCGERVDQVRYGLSGEVRRVQERSVQCSIE